MNSLTKHVVHALLLLGGSLASATWADDPEPMDTESPSEPKLLSETPSGLPSACADGYEAADSSCEPACSCANSANCCGCRNALRNMLQGNGTACSHCRAHLQYWMAALHSGQPLIDPWAKADWIAAQRAAVRSWHAGYYYTPWGAPVALVVPPTARMQTRWSWGVAQSTMSPLYFQFERPYPGPTGGSGLAPSMPLQSTPRWPSHTDQFGIYSVRGPW